MSEESYVKRILNSSEYQNMSPQQQGQIISEIRHHGVSQARLQRWMNEVSSNQFSPSPIGGLSPSYIINNPPAYSPGSPISNPNVPTYYYDEGQNYSQAPHPSQVFGNSPTMEYGEYGSPSLEDLADQYGDEESDRRRQEREHQGNNTFNQWRGQNQGREPSLTELAQFYGGK